MLWEIISRELLKAWSYSLVYVWLALVISLARSSRIVQIWLAEILSTCNRIRSIRFLGMLVRYTDLPIFILVLNDWWTVFQTTFVKEGYFCKFKPMNKLFELRNWMFLFGFLLLWKSVSRKSIKYLAISFINAKLFLLLKDSFVNSVITIFHWEVRKSKNITVPFMKKVIEDSWHDNIKCL